MGSPDDRLRIDGPPHILPVYSVARADHLPVPKSQLGDVVATVDNQAIIDKFDALESRMNERHEDIKARLERINGSVASHAD